MKRLVSTGLAAFGFAIGGAAQGIIALDNSANANGVAINTPGNYYSGTFGIEVWSLNASSVPPGINNNDPAFAYATVAGRFILELTLANQTMRDGTFSLGSWTLLGVSPMGSEVVIALAVWDNSATSWAFGLATADGHAGVLAFVNPTVAPTINGPPPVPASLSGWTTSIGDLVMITDVPEPSTYSLVGLGAAALLLFRRRK